MAATDCIQWRIAEQMIEQLKLIKTANSYKYNIPDANILVAQLETEINAMPGIRLHVRETAPTDTYHAVQSERYRYIVAFYNDHQDDNPKIYEDNKNIVADIMKSIMTDETYGCIALRTEKLDSSTTIDESNNYPFTFVNVRVQVLIDENNYYSQV